MSTHHQQQQQQQKKMLELGMVYMAAVQFPPCLQPLTDEQAASMLLRFAQKLPTTPFQWSRLDKPKNGHLAVVLVQHHQQQIDDGVFWQDAEVVRRVNAKEFELLVITREQGFLLGDQFVSMTRRRYQITQMQQSIQLIHYLMRDTNEPTNRIPVLPQMAAQAANFAAAKKKKVQIQQQLQNQSPSNQQHQPLQQQSQSLSTNDTNTAMEGDYLDSITARDMASTRYCRNHAYLSELFSHQHTSELIKESEPLFEKSVKEDISKKYHDILKQHEQDMKNMQAEKESKISVIKQESRRMMAHINKVPEYSGDLSELEKQVAKELHLELISGVSIQKHKYNSVMQGV